MPVVPPDTTLEKLRPVAAAGKIVPVGTPVSVTPGAACATVTVMVVAAFDGAKVTLSPAYCSEKVCVPRLSPVSGRITVPPVSGNVPRIISCGLVLIWS